MDDVFSTPFNDDIAWLSRYAKLPLHTGIGFVNQHGRSDDALSQLVRQIRVSEGQESAEQIEEGFEAVFLVPPAGNCLIFLRWPKGNRLGRNFGEGLTVTGESEEGNFRIFCPGYYIKSVSDNHERPGWAVASLVNEPATIYYGEERPITSVVADINNFDYRHGNQPLRDGDQQAVLRVEASGKTVDFRWKRNHEQLRRLVEAGIIGSTSLVTFSFSAWPEASVDDLTKFANNVARLCCYVAGQHTLVPILSFLDADGRVVRRTLQGVIQSRFRSQSALRFTHFEDGLPRLFRQCFEEHSRMQDSELWGIMPNLIASIEDPPYLEEKYAALMAGVERLIRNSLIEQNHLLPDNAHQMTLPKLVGLARNLLKWEVPTHYTIEERYRKTRNAVNHGGHLPYDARLVRADFDKWKLFLIRRLFIRMGFDGQVASPHKGWASSSPVGKFAEEYNAFPEDD